MNYNDFCECCDIIFNLNSELPEIDNLKKEKLYFLTQHMLEINKNMNLTAIKDEKTIIVKHYADSLTVSKYLKENAKIIDIGCGAGFPTLPLAIFRPDLKITAVDSTAKRIDYVTKTAELLKLENITAMSERAEILANSSEYREKFDYATARAVAALPILTELCLPFVSVGGSFIAMKSQKSNEEIDNSKNAILKCGGKLESNISILLVDYENNIESRNIIVINKVKETPKEFPRHYSKISKQPL